MNAAQIHAKIYAGRGKAALRLGQDCAVMRPDQAADPLANQIAVLKAAFNAGDNTYRVPNLPGKAIWFGDFDGNQTQPGDYLVRASDGQIYYIAAQQSLLPMICIECNRLVRVARAVPQGADDAVGAVGYSGLCDTPAQSCNVLGSDTAGWPCSILFGGRSQAAAGLPGDVKNTGWRILLPPSVPVVLRAGDIVADDLGRRYAIEGAELSDSGWRINAQEVHA